MAAAQTAECKAPVPVGAIEFSEFHVELKEAYSGDYENERARALVLVVDVSGEAEVNTQDYRLRRNALPSGEVPEPGGRYRFKPVGPMTVGAEFVDGRLRVKQVNDWEIGEPPLI